MKRVLSLLTVLMLLLACLGMAAAEETGVVVKNYKQLVEAVNDQQAERILVSPKYKHGTNEVINLYPDGRTVTVLPENGESAVINGRVDVYGPGSVIFENVSIAGPAGDAGLWVGAGAEVTVGTVTGGKAKKENGSPAVLVESADVTVGSATGGEGKGGYGGDGIFACGSSTVKVREAIGGSAKNGFGGSGVVAFGGTAVTVEGSAAGGDGLYAVGKGVLLGRGGTLSGEGAITDGAELNGKKKLDLEAVTSRNLLEYALRSGRNEILLDPKYKTGSSFPSDQPLFCPEAEAIRIANASEEKPATVDGGLRVTTGTWNLENIRFSLNSKDWDVCFWADGDSTVTGTGSISGKGSCGGIYASNDASVAFTGDCTAPSYAAAAAGNASIVYNGNITVTGKAEFGARSTGSASVTVNGDITVNGDSNALVCYGGKLEMTGSVTTNKNKDYPTIYSTGGEIILNGPIHSEGQAEAIYNKGGSVTVNGDIYNPTKKSYPVRLKENAGEVVINGTLTAIHTAIRADGGSVILNGDLIIRSKDNWATASWDDEKATVTINGEQKIVAP